MTLECQRENDNVQCQMRFLEKNHIEYVANISLTIIKKKMNLTVVILSFLTKFPNFSCQCGIKNMP